MIYAFGVLLIGGHFCLLVVLAQLCSSIIPGGSIYVFLIMSFVSGLVVINLQTRLERVFIGRHLKRNPDSWWNVLDLQGNA